MPGSAANKGYKFQSSTAVATPNGGVEDEALTQEVESQKIHENAVGPAKQRTGWEIKASALSLNTHNRIRNIVESMQIKPNPNKAMIPLSIGEYWKSYLFIECVYVIQLQADEFMLIWICKNIWNFYFIL